MNNLDEILKKFGESNTDICSIVTFGSFFHLDRKKSSDSLSDLDVFVFTDDVKKYNNQNKTEWLSSFPNSVLSVYLQQGDATVRPRVLFDNLFCMDLTIIDKKLLVLAKRYIQLKKFKAFRFLFKALRVDNYIASFSYNLSSGYKIAYSRDEFYPVINQLVKEYQFDTIEFNEENFKVNYNGFWQMCYKVYIGIKRDDMLYGVLANDNVLKKIIIELLVWKEQLNPHRESAIFKGKHIKKWGNDYYKEIMNDLMFNHKKEEAYATLLKNISFYKSACKGVSDWHLPDLEKSIISLLESEIKTLSIQNERNDAPVLTTI
ncbi:aminoglycoside 6-adenylyltransferase [Chryseobacterium carnipullorum]|uniref:aminoglycoside 6-adenylyltransferase n=1 Tax=Chryseobacterium carnipullorum TaxID=1124835 RepID=UPI000E838BC4|nr:aminoglycoside 6-adenylyltransferase [Chryseobacterium carnipullorum]HBV14237.1 hypothetical protein [Chryseobacterium carnipullorum]